MHRDEIEAGAALLDKYYPQWLGMIELDRLDMISANSCVLGQLGREFGFGFYEGLERLSSAEGIRSSLFGVEHGFDAASGSQEEFDELTDEWREYIAGRL